MDIAAQFGDNLLAPASIPASPGCAGAPAALALACGFGFRNRRPARFGGGEKPTRNGGR